VLTLAEAAAYLRVAEGELLRLAEQREIPAQRIGGEWRFLKRALGYWLTYGPRFHRDFREYPPWFLDHPVLEDILITLKDRLLRQLGPELPPRGSKQAIRRHVGVLKNESDLEEVIAKLSTLRGTGADEGANDYP